MAWLCRCLMNPIGLSSEFGTGSSGSWIRSRASGTQTSASAGAASITGRGWISCTTMLVWCCFLLRCSFHGDPSYGCRWVLDGLFLCIWWCRVVTCHQAYRDLFSSFYHISGQVLEHAVFFRLWSSGPGRQYKGGAVESLEERDGPGVGISGRPGLPVGCRHAKLEACCVGLTPPHRSTLSLLGPGLNTTVCPKADLLLYSWSTLHCL